MSFPNLSNPPAEIKIYPSAQNYVTYLKKKKPKYDFITLRELSHFPSHNLLSAKF